MSLIWPQHSVLSGQNQNQQHSIEGEAIGLVMDMKLVPVPLSQAQYDPGTPGIRQVVDVLGHVNFQCVCALSASGPDLQRPVLDTNPHWVLHVLCAARP